MADYSKIKQNKVFRKICAYNTAVKQGLGKYLNKVSPFAREYDSTLDLALAILDELGYNNVTGSDGNYQMSINPGRSRLITEILQLVIGENSVSSWIEGGYHGALNSLEEKLSRIEQNEEDDSFIYKLEGAAKSLISAVLTTLLSCSVSPFIPKRCIDTYYKNGLIDSLSPEFHPINIPTNILDYSNTLHVSPVSESGIYFYNTKCTIKYYKRDNGTVETSSAVVAGSKDPNAEKIITYKYNELTGGPDENAKFKKVVSVKDVRIREGQPAPSEYVYTIRPQLTADGLYKTDDMNAFIWYVANRGNNEGQSAPTGDAMYEYNKMMWDSRRINDRIQENRRKTGEEWNEWLNSKTNVNEKFVFKKDGETEIETLYPILQLEPSVDYGDLEHVVATFPAQRYLITKNLKYKKSINIPFTDKNVPIINIDKDINITRTIYKFNSDYLKSIKLFNWKTIVMNMLYELNGISPVPSVRLNLSLSDEIIDAKLSTLILNTIIADDKEIDDSYYSFSNEDYIAALHKMELTKYGAKEYKTASTTAIQNPSNTPIDAMNEASTAATRNDITRTIERQLYTVEGTSGSTGVTRTTLSANLLMETNFVQELMYAIIKPFIRALLSPQVMLLFIINLDVMGLIDISELKRPDMDMVSDFIFRKLTGIIKKLIIFIKNKIVKFLLELVRKALQKLIDQAIVLIILEQINDYTRLLNQILECIRNFGIGKTVSGIDEVTYADIIPEKNTPGEEQEE